jgi:hypothetical protein
LKFFKELVVCPERTDKGQMGSGRFFDRFFEKKSFFLEENRSLGSIRVLVDAFRTDGGGCQYIQRLPAGSFFDEKQTSLLPHWMLLN